MAFSVISTMEGSRVLFRNTSNRMSFGSNRPGVTGKGEEEGRRGREGGRSYKQMKYK
jgi:hypothetical protein